MKSYDEHKVEMENIQQQMTEANKNGRMNAITQRSKTFLQKVLLYGWDA